MKRFYYSVQVRSNLNVAVNHSIQLVFRVQALRGHVALVGVPNSVRFRYVQMASGGIKYGCLEFSKVPAAGSKSVVLKDKLDGLEGERSVVGHQ